MNRRRFLQAGGLAALLAACSSSGHPRVPTTTTTTQVGSPDVSLLRLASSLEHYAIGMYGQLAAAGLLTTATLATAARYFTDQHEDHANALQRATADAQGQPFTAVNPVIAQMLAPRVAALHTEADALKLAYDIESAVAATYFSVVGTFSDVHLNGLVMGVASVEARHAGVLGMALSGLPAPTPGIPGRSDTPPYPSGGFQTKDGAVPPGSGV